MHWWDQFHHSTQVMFWNNALGNRSTTYCTTSKGQQYTHTLLEFCRGLALEIFHSDEQGMRLMFLEQPGKKQQSIFFFFSKLHVDSKDYWAGTKHTYLFLKQHSCRSASLTDKYNQKNVKLISENKQGLIQATVGRSITWLVVKVNWQIIKFVNIK